ncbi:unnamed protein product [Meloidogyne enterolobii]|uniref:Uncharacterized protein n=1 Tax=Meloidogyne enterolobii TaxID=390850 RepID=A0ACB1B9S4_MELEN
MENIYLQLVEWSVYHDQVPRLIGWPNVDKNRHFPHLKDTYMAMRKKLNEFFVAQADFFAGKKIEEFDEWSLMRGLFNGFFFFTFSF